MTSSKEDRLAIYKEAYNELGLDSTELSRLMALGENTASNRHKINDKLKGVEGRGITKAEALLMQLLCILKRQGVDLKTAEFDQKGKLSFPPLTKKHNKE